MSCERHGAKMSGAEGFKDLLCCFQCCQCILELHTLNGLGFFNLELTDGILFFELALTEGFVALESAEGVRMAGTDGFFFNSELTDGFFI
jgi:hypothetical protein